jgi:hypothetical protein
MGLQACADRGIGEMALILFYISDSLMPSLDGVTFACEFTFRRPAKSATSSPGAKRRVSQQSTRAIDIIDQPESCLRQSS